MPSDFIAIDVQGLAELQSFLSKLPDAVADDGVDEANKYLLNVVRAYAPYKYITRAQAYPNAVITFPSGKQLKGWHSVNQFRYVMARINEGSINPGKPNRNQNLSKGWKIIGKGRKSILANEIGYAGYVQGSKGEQARMHTLIGWKGVDVIVKERMNTILEKFMVGVNKALKRLK
jgi:hypothetical protein